MEKITVDLIAKKEFSISSKGYNKEEVDNFLDAICEEMERMEEEIANLRQQTTSVRPTVPEAAAPSGVTEGPGRCRSHSRQSGDGSRRTAGRYQCGEGKPDKTG